MKPKKKKTLLKDNEVLILDGGLATELERMGFDLNHSLWSARLLLENPEAIKRVHLSYLEAGAQVVTTTSYQASFSGFSRLGFSEAKTEILLKDSVRIAVDARDEFLARNPAVSGHLIAASIGPYGAYMENGAEYIGDYGISNEELYDFHSRRWEVLADTEADLMACETIPDLREAEVLRGLIDQTVGKTLYISFSCRDRKHINDGTLIKECAEMFADCESVFAIGINCTAPRFVSSLIEEIAIGSPAKEIVVYPNSGEIYDAETKTWAGESSEKHFAGLAVEWFEKGARIIGGCCRTGPKHIREIRKVLSA